MKEKEWKDLYRKHRERTRGLHLYRGDDGELTWSEEDLPNRKRLCVGFSQFDKKHRCLSCLKNDPSDQTVTCKE